MNSKIEIMGVLNITDNSIYDYINEECFEKNKITKLLISYELKSCKEINS